MGKVGTVGASKTGLNTVLWEPSKTYWRGKKTSALNFYLALLRALPASQVSSQLLPCFS